MLQKVRGALKGAVAWFVIVLLIAAFALFGVPELGQLSGNSAIKVGERGYSANYVQQEFNRAMRLQTAQTGETITQEEAIAAGLDREIIRQIVTTAAADQFADRMGLAAPRELVARYLQSNENFRNPSTGKFDRFVLQNVLQLYNITPEEFERRIREDLERQQLLESLVTRAPAPSALTDLALLRETEQRRVRSVLITSALAGAGDRATEEEVRAYYEANPEAFTAPEYRTFDMLVLRNEDFRERDSIPEEELRRRYEGNLERLYQVPERRTLYQLTYDTEGEAEAARARLEQGAEFAALVEERGFSLENATNEEARRRDIVNPALAEAAFDPETGEGDVVGPVQSPFGWTIAEIGEVTPGETTPFEEAREEIEAQLLNQGTRRALNDALDEIEIERDTGASLAEAAEAGDIAVERVGLIDRFSFAPGGAIIPDIPGEALREAFQLEEDQQSEALPLADEGGYFIVAVREIRAPALIAFEDVELEARERLEKEREDARLAEAAEEFRAAVADGLTFEQAAEAIGAQAQSRVLNARAADERFSASLVEQLFAAVPGDIVTGAAGEGAGVVVAEVEEIGLARGLFPEEQRETAARYIGFALDQELIDAFLTEVQDEYRVNINEARLEAVFGERG